MSEFSFAEKYAKTKKTFTSQNVLEKAQESKSSVADLAASKPAENMAQSQIDPQKRAKADLIYLVKGVDAGRNAWYYVLVERLKLQLFLKALNDDIIHLENYGIILYSAYGDEPPADVTNKLKEEYGIK